VIRPSIFVVLVMLAGPLAGCGHAAPEGPVPPAPAPPATSVSPARPSSPAPAWGSGPFTVVHHPAVPPVPVVTEIRAGAHPGFDRIVFDVSGALPGYTVRYVDHVRSDPADRPIAVPGRAHLLVMLSPAQAHRADGTATVTGVHRIGLTALTAYAMVGDFEGHTSIAVGTAGHSGFRVGELPGRIYVDVAH